MESPLKGQAGLPGGNVLNIPIREETKMSQPAPGARTNGLAIAAFVMSLVGFGVIAAIMGHVAMGNIKRTGEGGNGLAIAAVVIGWVSFAIGLFWLASFSALLAL